ncbi:hypothetical protein BCD48_15225 [Pseudofrankia sp. BMG5.36]|nr:hypothetical protein BCD48_15225 [Pseudofrankia sp. BMG5.36]
MTVPERRPNRFLGGVHDEFWQFCNRGELRLQRCTGCSSFAWPPVTRCAHCGGDELDWRRVAGTGELVSWATFEHRYHWEIPLPWDTILVELDEGPLFVSNPVGFTRDEMTPAMPVEVEFIECEDDAGAFRLPVFRKHAR